MKTPYRNIFPLFFAAIPFLFPGCAHPPQKGKPPSPPEISKPSLPREKDPFSGFAERYRNKARQEEQKGDLPKAIKNWEIVKSLLPADPEAGARIAALQTEKNAAAGHHFQKGVANFQNHSYPSARKEFLLTLYLKPDHAEALQYLKQKMAGEDSLIYPIKKGDTLKGLATKIYGDPKKDFLIAYFNGLKTDSRLEPPRVLIMPAPDFQLAKKFPDRTSPEPVPEFDQEVKELLEKTRAACHQGNFPETAALTQKLLEYDPANKETHELMNTCYYQWGQKFSREKKYEEALRAFQRVDSGYRDVRILIAHHRKQLAEIHYINGVTFFVDEEIEKAIQEWEITLSFDPNHPKAKTDIENGRNLLKKLEKIK